MESFKTWGTELFHPSVTTAGQVEHAFYVADGIDSGWAPLDAPIEMPAGSTMRYEPDPANRFALTGPFAVTSLTHRCGTY